MDNVDSQSLPKIKYDQLIQIIKKKLIKYTNKVTIIIWENTVFLFVNNNKIVNKLLVTSVLTHLMEKTTNIQHMYMYVDR